MTAYHSLKVMIVEKETDRNHILHIREVGDRAIASTARRQEKELNPALNMTQVSPCAYI